MAGCLFAPYPARLAQVLWGILAGGCFFGSARLVFHPLEHLAHPNVFVGLCLWDCFTGFLLYLSHAKLPFVPVMLLFAANAALFALIHNRDAMERMLSGRDGDTWELPTEIRKSNGKLMGVLCGIRAASGAVQPDRWQKSCVGRGGCCTRQCGTLCVGCFSRGSQEQTAELPEDTSEQVMQLQQNGAAGWIRLVIELVLLAAVLVLVIWKRREIGDALLSAWYSLRHWIQQHLRKNHAEQRNDRHEAYCDYVEDLLTAEQPAPSAAALYRRRDWKKAYRRYQRLPEQAERFRLGYALLLARLPEEVALPAASPVEILNHLSTGGEQETLPQWNTVTEAYTALRYGEILPEHEAFAAMDTLLKRRS